MTTTSPAPHCTSLATIALALAVTALLPSCATAPRLTNLSDPSCSGAVREAIQSLLRRYESPSVSADLADRALSSLQKSSPTPASFAVLGGPSTRTFGFLIEARAGACVIVLQSATLYTTYTPQASPISEDVAVSTPRNLSTAFERVLPACVCGR